MFIIHTAHPKTLTQVMGTGSDLYVPENIAELAALSGMPEEHANRTVVIGQRINKTLQSGDCFAHQWQITWKNKNRWSNPLMGWTSTADPMSNMKVRISIALKKLLFLFNYYLQIYYIWK